MQLIGSLISGWLIDHLGCKKVVLLSFLASAACYGITAYATTLQLLYISQIPTIFQHAVLAARAYVSIATDEEDRARHMGYVMFAYGIGMIVGPTLGGILSQQSLYYAASAATIGSIASIVLVTLFLDDTTPSSSSSKSGSDADPKSPSGASSSTITGAQSPAAASSSLSILSDQRLVLIFAVKILFGLSHALFHSVFSLVAADRFGLDAKGTGFLLSFVGGVGMLVNGFMITPAQKLLTEKSLLVSMAVGLVLTFLGFAFASSAVHMYAIAVPMVIFSSIFNVVTSAALTRLVPVGLRGTVNAWDMGLGSAVRMVSPTIGAYMLASSYGFESIGVGSAACNVLVLAMLLMPATAGAFSGTSGNSSGGAAKSKKQQ